jgi:hypothetical protein
LRGSERTQTIYHLAVLVAVGGPELVDVGVLLGEAEAVAEDDRVAEVGGVVAARGGPGVALQVPHGAEHHGVARQSVLQPLVPVAAALLHRDEQRLAVLHILGEGVGGLVVLPAVLGRAAGHVELPYDIRAARRLHGPATGVRTGEQQAAAHQGSNRHQTGKRSDHATDGASMVRSRYAVCDSCVLIRAA